MAVKCPTPGCKVSETGKCLEGFPIDQCPHVSTVEETEDTTSLPAEITPEVEEVTIPIGRVLSLQEATDVLVSGPSRVLTIIGPSRSGKTTFTISIYDALQYGSFGPFGFSGSLTLPGFELRCHLSRAQSGSSEADTPRSLLTEGLGFLHLNLHSEVGRQNLLISERSGEHYERVANSLENASDLLEVKRADYLLFFVDGEKLSSNSERHGVKTDMVTIVKTLLESKIISNRHRIGIVLTKMDCVLTSPNPDRAVRDFDDLVARLRKLFFPDQDISQFQIASRSTHLDIPNHLGVIELLQQCLGQSPEAKYVPDAVTMPTRCFLKLPHHPAETL